MEKKINYTHKGERANIEELKVMRMFPNSRSISIGPYVFLDHVPLNFVQRPFPRGRGAHPHRGIATFTYLLQGAIEHYDSQGNHGVVEAGGIQWMKAGSGVIHEENIPAKYVNGLQSHVLQFWVNLPGRNKAEYPKYLPVQNKEVPEVALPDGAGTLRVLIGSYEGRASVIDTYTPQFIYHILLQPNSKFRFPTEEHFEYAAFLPSEAALINQNIVNGETLVVFDQEGTGIAFENPSSGVTDIILFGGEPYQEPMVAHGPFVMNSIEEIYLANQDFQSGKYGQINYLN